MKGTGMDERKWHHWDAKPGMTTAYCRACGVHAQAVTPQTEFFCVCWKMRLPKQRKEK